jgi:dihydropteroate synthase
MASSADRFLELCAQYGTVWMGILNTTPDSFSDGGRYTTVDEALRRARELVTHGATVLDVGGVSTRPGSVAPSQEEERRRVAPLLRELRRRFNSSVLLSLDTFRPSLAAELAAEGLVDIINDVEAAQVVETTLHGERVTTAHVAQKFDLGLVLMHMRGEPKTMQENPRYNDCLAEVCTFLRERAAFASQLGCRAIALDPGIGFGKRFEDNEQLLSETGIKTLAALGYPLLVGLSRKRFLQEWFAESGADLAAPSNRDPQSKELESVCIARGAKIIRSHRMPSEVLVQKIEATL